VSLPFLVFFLVCGFFSLLFSLDLFILGTIFGEVVSGMETVDKIAAEPTSKGDDMNRPLQDVRILSTKLIRRKTYEPILAQ